MTQDAAILAYLQTGASITPLEALDKFGCFRLASVVFRLRKQGHIIGTEYPKSSKKQYAVYRLHGPHTPAATTTIAPPPTSISRREEDLFGFPLQGGILQ